MLRSMLALSLIVVTAGSGCGLLFTRGPGPYTPHAPPECTTSRRAVFGDTVVMGAAMGTALFLLIAAAAEEADRAEGETNRAAHASLYTFLGAVGFSVSGIIGGVRVKRCRRAHERWRTLHGAPPPPPPVYAPPPTR